MKIILTNVTLAVTIFLSSCGGSKEEEKKAMTVCDCVKIGDEMMKELKDDGSNAKELEEKYADKIAECKKMAEGKSDEEKKKMAEEARDCK